MYKTSTIVTYILYSSISILYGIYTAFVSSRSDNCLAVNTSQYAELLEGGFISPFNFVKVLSLYTAISTYIMASHEKHVSPIWNVWNV